MLINVLIRVGCVREPERSPLGQAWLSCPRLKDWAASQGRVFSVRRLIAQITVPIAMLMAGILADKIFEPALMTDTLMSSMVGWLVGADPGSGMGLILVISGIFAVVVGVMGYMFPTVRNVETILPDHDKKPRYAIDQKKQRLEESLDTRRLLLNQTPSTDRDQALKKHITANASFGH